MPDREKLSDIGNYLQLLLPNLRGFRYLLVEKTN